MAFYGLFGLFGLFYLFGFLKTKKEAFDTKNAPVETPVKVAASSSDFVKTTLETAVSEGWTKTKTVEELRKSEERITIKKARDLVKEAFEAKSEPIAIKA